MKKSFGEEPATPQKVGTCQLARKMDHISKEDLKIYNYLNVARKNAKLNMVASSLSGLSSLTSTCLKCRRTRLNSEVSYSEKD